LRIILKNIV